MRSCAAHRSRAVCTAQRLARAGAGLSGGLCPVPPLQAVEEAGGDEHDLRSTKARVPPHRLSPLQQDAGRQQHRLPSDGVPTTVTASSAGRPEQHPGTGCAGLPLSSAPFEGQRRPPGPGTDGSRFNGSPKHSPPEVFPTGGADFQGPATIVWGDRDPVLGQASKLLTEALEVKG